ncbi:hypothetical protein HanRHA438_Chr07g0291911 [Helianthus annuus]|uniref:Uncharacterized protein n=1 Tax=Helianthus annuus TaxID=4232 RepID=A0A9K3IIH1_HELAN|nr:hypothetical protein HanXRQr2_Chr07g0281361 [Helianthus annuus]KAJ0549239.1 hypothetical protein HanHA300_Chr07g0231241 [Helianthus annuus]KAJ0562194.1 hypothetical protein HanHA89_Chr07g0248411 [Helianthus annuus]KAJ0727568.1 hypothetical protein HanLR1_Chr07g0231211 [Helianthus annuus]KAJ0730362.1 hypothetical protein HanOQP8_Chr07g0239101 [Helianthus annuus]
MYSWESLGKLPFSPLNIIYHPCHLEKAVHWLCVDGTVPYFIVFFNFETREVGEIPGPAQVVLAHPYANDFLTLVTVFQFLTVLQKQQSLMFG